jgi:hypothetical protein
MELPVIKPIISRKNQEPVDFADIGLIAHNKGLCNAAPIKLEVLAAAISPVGHRRYRYFRINAFTVRRFLDIFTVQRFRHRSDSPFTARLCFGKQYTSFGGLEQKSAKKHSINLRYSIPVYLYYSHKKPSRYKHYN